MLPCVNSLFQNQALYLCCVFALGPGSSTLTDPAFLSSICLFIHFSFFPINYFPLLNLSSKESCGPPECPKSLFITVTRRSKACAFSWPCPWGLLHFCAWFPVRCHSGRLMKGHDSQKKPTTAECYSESRTGEWFNCIS